MMIASCPPRRERLDGDPSAERTIAVALHGIEPATFQRCALIRDWLSDHGVDRATLLVIPARDLHPIASRSPGMVEWLSERRRLGDAIAQHGFQHARRPHGRRRAEFVGLDGDETRRAVHAGWRVLKLAGIAPDGFVAPSYAYTPALRETLEASFRWWASLLRVHTSRALDPDACDTLAPAWRFTARGPFGRLLSPPLVRLGSMLPAHTLRVDLHPADLERPRHMMALEWMLARSTPRRLALTYEDVRGRRPSPGAGAPRLRAGRRA